ncbi:unnamed protein product [Schistosoma mattheei]|uniref:SLC26A/SulP transporter domain-containing protein n=1 Tax=Schistosoma mattheei TaxID=31246 RepID=A0A3P8D6K9_9TREM|nr:unnamed protein product [Schistosoma mattheei]
MKFYTFIGTFSVVSLLTADPVDRLTSLFDVNNHSLEKYDVFNEKQIDDFRLTVVITVCILTGLFQVALGILRLGVLVVYISEPLLSGFTCASAVHVFTSQLNGLFGIRLNRATGPFRVFYLTAGTVISKFGLLNQRYGVSIVGEIPVGLPSPVLPDIRLVPEVLMESIIVSFVSLATTISLVKLYAKKGGYNVGYTQRVDRFTYLGSLISHCGLVCDEISARIQKARLVFANLRHLWCRRDIRLSTKGRVYCAAVRSVLFNGSETWPVRVVVTLRLLVFDHRCLRNIARISWDHRVSNTVVMKRVLGKDGKSIDDVVKLHQLRWLVHVLRMPNDRLPRRAMFSGIGELNALGLSNVISGFFRCQPSSGALARTSVASNVGMCSQVSHFYVLSCQVNM